MSNNFPPPMRSKNRHIRRPALLALLCISVLQPFSLSALSTTPALPGIAAAITPDISFDAIPGAVTYVATRDGVAHLQAHGYDDLLGKKSMRTDNIFRIASMTKIVTATAVMILHDEGKLDIDNPAAKYIPELAALRTPSGKPAVITIRQMLAHTSGMGGLGKEENKIQRTLAEFVPIYAKLKMRAEPGAEWKYNRVGMNLSARIVERISGMSFDQFIQKRIFDPLEMPDTAFNQPPEKRARIVNAFYTHAVTGKLAARKYSPDKVQMVAGDGGLTTTAADFGRLCRMLLNEGELDGARLMRPETVRLMRAPETGDLKAGFSPGHAWAAGVGVVMEPRDDNGAAALSPGSFGHVGAYGTQAWIDPVKGAVYIIFIQNNTLPGNLDDSPIRKHFQQAARDALATKK